MKKEQIFFRSKEIVNIMQIKNNLKECLKNKRRAFNTHICIF